MTFTFYWIGHIIKNLSKQAWHHPAQDSFVLEEVVAEIQMYLAEYNLILNNRKLPKIKHSHQCPLK
jgi:hypothetical protein